MIPSEILAGLPEETKQALVLLMTSLKQAGTKRKSLNEELIMWQDRIKLAQQNNREDLVVAAQGRYDEVQTSLDALAAEEAQYRSEFEQIKSNLVFESTEGQKEVNVDLLQAEFDLFVGEAPSAEEVQKDKDFQNMDADIALDALKKQMAEEDQS